MLEESRLRTGFVRATIPQQRMPEQSLVSLTKGLPSPVCPSSTKLELKAATHVDIQIYWCKSCLAIRTRSLSLYEREQRYELANVPTG